MAKKYQYDRLEDVPEADRGDYIERDGKFILDIEGGEDVSGLKSALQKEREARKAVESNLRAQVEKYKDLDPDKARMALERLQEMEDQQLLDAGKVEELLTKRTERMRVEHEQQMNALKKVHEGVIGERDKATLQLSEVLIDAALTKALLGAGVRKDALDYALLKGKQVWKLRDGEPIASNGESLIYGKSGTNMISMDEWAGDILSGEAPFLFESSGGGGGMNNVARTWTGGTTVRLGDQRGINSNLENIASGKVTVVD